MKAHPHSVRAFLFVELEPTARPTSGLSRLNWVITALILLSSLVAILETEPIIMQRFGGQIEQIEILFGLLFSIEFILRLWTVVEGPTSLPNWRKRLQFLLSPASLVDIVVIVATLSPAILTNVVALRFVRLARILRLAKLGRMSLAMRRLKSAIHSRRYELALTIGMGIGLLVFGATALYLIEGELQPDKFGSIPRSLWWAVVTMTTIGYGDVYPITVLGKAVAAFVAVAGIGLIAMPTGILAAAFSDAMQARHDD